MFTHADLPVLALPLPEDLMRIAANGDLAQLRSLIELRLAGDLPAPLRTRLEYELYCIPYYQSEYTYSYTDALAMLTERIRDFDEAELQGLLDANAIEWIFIGEQQYFLNSFFANLVKTNPGIAARQVEPGEPGDGAIRDEIVRYMMEHGSATYALEMTHTLQVNEGVLEAGEHVEVHVPIPAYAKQVHDVQVQATPEPAHISGPEMECRTVYFEGPLPDDRTFSVEYSFVNHVDYVVLDPGMAGALHDAPLPGEPEGSEVTTLQPKPAPAYGVCEHARYAQDEQVVAKDRFDATQEVAPHIVFTPTIKAMYEHIVGYQTNPIAIARTIYDYVTTHINYSFMRSYITIPNIPEFALINAKGDCGVQALTFITLCRYAGIPATWQAGLYANEAFVGNHDWVEFYVEPYGWVFADLSFGGGAYRAGNKTKWDFYFGNLDPYRVPATQRFQAAFTPPTKHLNQDPYDNQSGEIQTRERSLRHHEYSRTMTLRSITRIED